MNKRMKWFHRGSRVVAQTGEWKGQVGTVLGPNRDYDEVIDVRFYDGTIVMGGINQWKPSCGELKRVYHSFGRGELIGICSRCGYICRCSTCKMDRERAKRAKERRYG